MDKIEQEEEKKDNPLYKSDGCVHKWEEKLSVAPTGHYWVCAKCHLTVNYGELNPDGTLIIPGENKRVASNSTDTLFND